MLTAHPPRSTRRRAAVLLFAGLALAACGACAGAPRRGAPAGAWRPLLGARSLDAWRGYRGADVPPGWTVVDGVLGRHVSTGDLVTRAEFGDFELRWEWKLAPGGDAGVFYRGTEDGDRLYWSGVEYQLQDDAHPLDGPSRLAAAGAVYGLYPVRAGVVRPAGEWNASRMVARGAQGAHGRKGQRGAESAAGSPAGAATGRASTCARGPAGGRARRGHIAIQGDHATDLAIRDLRIREFPASPASP